MGDNAGDFQLVQKVKTLAERNAIIDTHKEGTGTTFVVFPNPAYGSLGKCISKRLSKPQSRRTKTSEQPIPTTIRMLLRILY